MKVILRLDDAGDRYTIYTSKRNLKDVMREMWEEVYNECLADGTEITEEDTWFEDDQAQIVSNGWFIVEFKIMDVEEIE